MNILAGFITSIKKTFDYKGRSRRAEFWSFCLCVFLTCFLLGFFDKVFFGVSWPFIETISYRGDGEVASRKFGIRTNYGPISNLASLIFIIPMLSAIVRRLHDSGRSGLFLLLPLAPILIMSIMGKRQLFQYIHIAILVFLLVLIYMTYLFFKDSDYNNKYGASEKYPNDGSVSNPMMDG